MFNLIMIFTSGMTTGMAIATYHLNKAFPDLVEFHATPAVISIITVIVIGLNNVRNKKF